MSTNEVYVANGEQARVIEVSEKYIVAELSNPKRVIRIPVASKRETNEDEQDQETEESGSGCDWDLAFAISVHKSQGSDWPVVIVMIDDYAGARMVCSREWIYTAISRAKEQCVLIGNRETANGMCRRPALGRRKTLLKERILLEQARRVLADL